MSRNQLNNEYLGIIIGAAKAMKIYLSFKIRINLVCKIFGIFSLKICTIILKFDYQESLKITFKPS